MNRSFCLLLIIAAASHFGTNQVFAQKARKPKEVIILEFSALDQKSIDKVEIPIDRTSQGKLEYGGEAINECMASEGCGEMVNDSYEYYGKVFAINKTRTKLSFRIKLDDDCRARKIFTVYRNQKTKLRLNCGITLIAYYGFESKEAN